MCVYTCICICVPDMSLCVHVCIHRYVNVCWFLCMGMRVCMCVRACVCVCVFWTHVYLGEQMTLLSNPPPGTVKWLMC